MWQGRWGRMSKCMRRVQMCAGDRAEINAFLEVRTPKPLTLHLSLPIHGHQYPGSHQVLKPRGCQYMFYLLTEAMKSTPADPRPNTRGGMSVSPFNRRSDMVVAAMEQRRPLQPP